MLVCPICKEKLEKKERNYECCNKHSFDIAKQGYVNLLIKHSATPGDDKESLNSRKSFLEKGYYQPLAEKLTQVVDEYICPNGKFLDAGCGTGYYLNYINLHKKNNYELYATDIAKVGVMMCAKLVKEATCFVGNVFHLPFANESLDGLMSVFTPYGADEFYRVIKTGGYVIAVTPGQMHLLDCKGIVYETPYFNDEAGYNLPGFSLVKKENVIYNIHIDNNEDIHSLWRMMPYYHTTSKENNDKLLCLNEVDTCVDFLVSIYRKEQ